MSFFPAAVLSRTDVSSVIDAQNSVTSKPLVGWDCMSNGWEDERVVHIFRTQFRVRITPEQPQISFFFRCCIQSKNAISATHHGPKIVTSKPLTV
jgi:hypothetical protein